MNFKILFAGLIKANELRGVVLISSCLFSVGAVAQTNHPTGNLAPSKGNSNAGQLAPEDIQAIRIIGRAVLSTRQGFVPDPTQETVHQEVKALAAELDNALKTVFTTPPSLNFGKRTFNVSESKNPATLIEQSNLQLVGGNGVDSGLLPQGGLPVKPAATAATVISVPAQMSAGQTSGISDFDPVRARLDSIRQFSETLTATRIQGNARSENTAQLSAKANALQDEVGTAINISSITPADATRLSNLRDRLRPKTLEEVMAEQDTARREAGQKVPEPTPSISTLTRHR